MSIQRIPDEISQAVRWIGGSFRISGLQGYNPEDGSGFWRKVFIRSNQAGHVMVVVYVMKHSLSNEELYLVKDELAKVAVAAKFASLYLSEEPGAPSHLVGATHIVERIGGIKYPIAPKTPFPVSFNLKLLSHFHSQLNRNYVLQENTRLAEVYYENVIQLHRIHSKTNVIAINCQSAPLFLVLAKVTSYSSLILDFIE